MSENYSNEEIKEGLIKLEILEYVKHIFSVADYKSSPIDTIAIFDMINDLLNPNDCKNSKSKDLVDTIYKQTEEMVEEVLKTQSSTKK